MKCMMKAKNATSTSFSFIVEPYAPYRANIHFNPDY